MPLSSPCYLFQCNYCNPCIIPRLLRQAAPAEGTTRTPGTACGKTKGTWGDESTMRSDRGRHCQTAIRNTNWIYWQLAEYSFRMLTPHYPGRPWYWPWWWWHRRIWTTGPCAVGWRWCNGHSLVSPGGSPPQIDYTWDRQEEREWRRGLMLQQGLTENVCCNSKHKEKTKKVKMYWIIHWQTVTINIRIFVVDSPPRNE